MRLVLLPVFLVLMGCSEPKSETPDDCCGPMNLPPSKTLSDQEEAQALTLYDTFTTVIDAASDMPPATGRIQGKKDREEIQNMIMDSCELSVTESTSGRTSTALRTAKDITGKTCPISYTERQTTTVTAAEQTRLAAHGTVSTKLRVTGPDLAALTPVNFYESAGRLGVQATSTSPSTAKLSVAMNQQGTLGIDGTELETFVKARMTVTTEDGNFRNGKSVSAVGAKSSFGWLILRMEETYTDGVLTTKCYLNDKDISTYPQCQGEPQKVFTTDYLGRAGF